MKFYEKEKNEKSKLYQQQTNLSTGEMQATLVFQFCEKLINTPWQKIMQPKEPGKRQETLIGVIHN